MKILSSICSLLLVIGCLPLFAQEDPNTKDTSNPLYEPVAVVQRLSYDNFKNIKLLTTAILNFGGGEAEFNRLVDGYADASALYFSRDYKKAADAFTKNEKEIKEVAMKLAAKYKQDAEALNREIIAHNVKARIKKSLDGKKQSEGDLSAEKLLGQSSESVSKANDSYIRVRPVQSISLFRRSKDQSIQYYEAMKVKEINGVKLTDRFERERADNRNKIYVSKEKKN